MFNIIMWNVYAFFSELKSNPLSRFREECSLHQESNSSVLFRLSFSFSSQLQKDDVFQPWSTSPKCPVTDPPVRIIQSRHCLFFLFLVVWCFPKWGPALWRRPRGIGEGIEVRNKFGSIYHHTLTAGNTTGFFRMQVLNLPRNLLL